MYNAHTHTITNKGTNIVIKLLAVFLHKEQVQVRVLRVSGGYKADIASPGSPSSKAKHINHRIAHIPEIV